jgi:type IV secretory pathway TrbL component
MKTISIRHGLGPLQTTDSPRHDALGSALAEIEISLGVLDPADLAKVRAILQKYVGGSSANVNELGIVRASDASDAADAAGRQAAAGVARNIAHNQSVARGYADFWDRKNQELHDSVRR